MDNENMEDGSCFFTLSLAAYEREFSNVIYIKTNSLKNWRGYVDQCLQCYDFFSIFLSQGDNSTNNA